MLIDGDALKLVRVANDAVNQLWFSLRMMTISPPQESLQSALAARKSLDELSRVAAGLWSSADGLAILRTELTRLDALPRLEMGENTCTCCGRDVRPMGEFTYCFFCLGDSVVAFTNFKYEFYLDRLPERSRRS